MKCLSFFAIISVLSLIALPVHAYLEPDIEFTDDVRDEVVSLFGAYLVPSVFTTASLDKMTVSLYGRTLTGEDEVPDFDGSSRDVIDEMNVYANVRMGGLGLTLGFGQGNAFEFSKPVVMSVDYKLNFMEEDSTVNTALDLQYSMIALRDEENIQVSALGFGVVSVNGLISAEVLHLLEPYAGITFHYIYLNSDLQGNIRVWKIVPKLGLRANILPAISATSEVTFIKNEHPVNSVWMWNIGVSVNF